MMAREQRSAPTYFTLKSCSNSSSMTASIGPVAIVGGSVLPMANALTSVNRKDASGAEFIGRIRRGRGVMADITQTTQPSIAAPKIRAGVSGTRLKQAVLGLAMIAGIFAAAEYGPAPFRSRRGGRRVISGRET